MSDKKNSITIKKYANRRLYNTATSSYVTLEDLSVMVKNNENFNVYDAKSSEDITRSVLTQIIMEEENKSGQQNLLPTNFLRQLIGFYGNNLQWMVPKYLENSMDMLSNNQEQIQDYFKNTLGSMFPFGSTFEEMSKQNLSMFENTMRMISPFGTSFDLTNVMQQAQKTVSDNTQNTASAKASCSILKNEPKQEQPKTQSCPTSACNLSSQPQTQASTLTSASSASTTSKSESCKVASITNLKPKKESKKQTKKDKKKAKKKESKSSSNEKAQSKPVESKQSSNTPMPNVTAASSNNAGADDMQQKIANLQRQLADLAKSRA